MKVYLGTDHYFLSGGYHFWDLQTIFISKFVQSEDL